ncbi:UNVERIFIED_ORG: hypothetical protein M2414_000019 [Rahnella aquatilis]
MSNNVSGKENRTAGRDFHESNVLVDQHIGRDMVNILIPGSKEFEFSPLVPAQRKLLNQLVKDVAEASNEEGFVVWQRVHAEIGINSVNEMTKKQYPAALEYLQGRLDELRDTSACKALMHQLLKKTADAEQRQSLYQYCDISFGSRRLAELTKAQLQQALGWLCNEQHEDEKLSQFNVNHLSVFDLLRNSPKEVFVIFLIGVLLGAIIF